MNLDSMHGLGVYPAVNRPLILIAEDDEINLLLVTHALNLFGFAQVSTARGQEVLGLAQTHRPDLILLDLVLPDLSGLDVLQSLQQSDETRSIPVVAMTALPNSEEQQQLLHLGCSACLQKPYSLSQLKQVLLQNIIQMQSAS